MITNGKRAALVIAGAGVLVMVFASGLFVRALGVETREEARIARDTIKIELQGDIGAVEARHQKHEAALRAIDKQVERTATDVVWIKDALRESGYGPRERSP